jgi:hypothetical protein
MIKILSEFGIEGMYLNIIKTIHEKFTANFNIHYSVQHNAGILARGIG